MYLTCMRLVLRAAFCTILVYTVCVAHTFSMPGPACFFSWTPGSTRTLKSHHSCSLQPSRSETLSRYVCRSNIIWVVGFVSSRTFWMFWNSLEFHRHIKARNHPRTKAFDLCSPHNCYYTADLCIFSSAIIGVLERSPWS